MNILIVDDSEDVRRFLMQLLRDQGHAVREAVNGQEGLARVRERRPDAIISDGLMPVMDGFQLLQALKKDPGLSSIPFLFHSSVYTGQREQELARSLGADAFLVKPQPPQAILDALHAAKSGRDAVARDHPALTGNDAEFAQEYSRVVATALENKVGQLERVTRDLERTKKVLQESEVVYRGLFENNPQPMWVYDVETLAFLAVNDTAIISYGFTREEFLAMTIKDIRRPEDVQKLISRVSTPADGFDSAGIWKHRKKDGTIIDVEITSHTLKFSGQRAKLVLANDVTERTLLEQAILRASDEWRATFDAMTEAVALLDADGKIIRCNKAMALLAKKPFSAIIGQACTRMCACFGGTREECPFIKSKETLKRETVVFKQGEQWFEASADPIVDETGALQGAVHILQEITERKHAEETLRKREAQLAESQRIAGIGSWERDLTTNAVVWSKELFRILGLDPERVTPSYEALQGLIHPDDRETQMRTVQQAIQGNKPYRTEFRIQRKDGTTAVIHTQGEVVYDEAGRPVLLRGTAQDITERRRLEDELKAAAARAEDEKAKADSIVAAIGDGITIQDRNFRILYQNQAAKKMIGNHVGELCYRAYEKRAERCEGCGVAQVFKDGGTHVVERSAPTDKGLLYAEITASPLRDAKGDIIAGIEVVHDITKRKQRDAALLASEERHRLIFQGSPVGIFHYDTGLTITECNDRFIEILKTKREKLMGLDMHILRDQRVLPSLKTALAGKEGRYEGAYKATTSSAEIWVSMRTAPLFDLEGAVKGGVGIVEDITERREAEESLRKQQRFTDNLIMNSAIATFVLDASHRVLIWNKACEELTGVPAAEMIGSNGQWRAFYDHERPVLADVVLGQEPEKLSSLYPSFSLSTLTQEGIHAEGWFANLNKRDRYVVFDAAPIRDGDGAIVAAIETLQDFTERKQAEESLRESEERYRNVIENAFDLIQSVSPDGRFLYVNPAWSRTIGFSLEELRDKTIFDIIHPSCKSKCSSVFSSMATGAALEHFETQFMAKGGRVIDIEGSATSRTVNGKVVSMQCLLHDVTERKKLEEELYGIKQDWEYTFNSITDMVTVHDKDYNIILANKAAEKILHLPLLENMKDRKCFSYYHGTDHAPEGCPSCGCLQTGVSATFELFEPHLGMFIEIRAIPRFDSNNQLIGLIHVVRDITERKRAQDALNERVHQAALGAEIGVALTKGGDLGAMLQQCAEAMVRHLDAAFARIWTLNTKEQVLEMQASAGMYTHLNGPHGRVPMGKFKIGLIAEERKPHMTNEVVGDPRIGDQEWARREGMAAFAGYPLIVQDKLVGVMAMFSRKQLPETTMNSLGSVADIVALGIERKRTEDSLSRYSRELTALNTASNTLMLTTNLSDIYQEICNIIYSVLELKMVWLGIIDGASSVVRPVAFAGAEDGYLSTITVTWDDSPAGAGPTGMAIKTREPRMMTPEAPEYAPWRERAKVRGFSSSLAVPLLYARDKCVGALNFYSDKADYFTTDRVNLCQVFANQAAVAIENARLVEELEEKVLERTKQMEDANIELQTVNKELVLRREEADAASRSKTDFLANMSHELRTPLNAIMGFSEIMLMGMAGQVSDKQQEFLNDISNSGKHLLSLINDILDLSKVEAGKVELEPEPLNVTELISGSQMMFKEKALKHSIRMETFIDPAVPQIIADRRMLKQVLVNLLSNAFKFTPDGGSVSVLARRVASSKGHVARVRKEESQNDSTLPLDPDFIEISVTDTGVGITTEHQQKLFQPFTQIDSSLTRKHAGTGLGLSLCRRFVELHGGRIWVESEPGKGSTFRFVVPVGSGAASSK